VAIDIEQIMLVRFFFFSNEGTEPPHVHVEYANGHAKFWLNPVELASSVDLKPAELKRASVTEPK